MTTVRMIGFAFTDAALDALDDLPPKLRRQIIKKAKALHIEPYPAGCKKLVGVQADDGVAVYRVRSGDYRILYIVRAKPDEVIIIDVDHRKDVYKMPKSKSEPADELRMKESEFDDLMQKALGVPAPADKPKKVPEKEDEKPRLSAYPTKKVRN